MKLIKEKSNLTYLVPAAFWSDEYSSRVLRKYVFANYKVNYIYQFENQKRLQDIDARFKFVIFQFSNIKTPTSNFRIKFKIQGGDNIIKEITRDLKNGEDNPYKGIELNVNQIKKLFPIQESIIYFKDNE
ncbi:hypothetical protein [Borreliella carolinensis]|uniref:hypothetical protein n=1 Tax=Borreliella carolinensis TaxID=478174 RepID=UPI003AEF66AC